MILPDLTEKTYTNKKTVTEEYTVTENGRYTFVVIGENGRQTTRTIEVKNAMSAADIELTQNTTEATKNNVIVTIRYDENVKVGGQVLTNAERFQ